MNASGTTTGLHTEGAPSFRDMAGVPVDCGRVAPHRLYRSGALTALTEVGATLRDQLGVRLVCDLRTPLEREHDPARWPEPSPTIVTASEDVDLYGSKNEDILALYAAETGEQAREAVMRMYADMPRAYADILRELFVHLTDLQEFPVLIHCSAGKDRTGFVSSMVLLALGASPDIVTADYMLTDRVWGPEQVRQAIWSRTGREPATEVIEALRVRPEYLEHALDAIRNDHGSLDAYFQSVGLDEARRLRLREALVIG
jgi:protein-tyrosine phosphatase